MNKKIAQEIFSDEQFVKSLMELESAEDVQSALSAKGLELSLEEINQIKVQLSSGNSDELSADDLEGVAGGKAIIDIEINIPKLPNPRGRW